MGTKKAIQTNTGSDKAAKAWDYVRDYSRHCDVNEYLGEELGDRFLTYRTRWREATSFTKEFDFPLFLVFETMFKCNLKCVMCLHSSPGKEVYSYDKKLPISVFKNIMKECALHYCPSMTFGGTSEPLLDPDLVEMIRLAKGIGFIDIMLNTNATLLDPVISRRLIDSGLTRLRVGFDGLTKGTYEKIRIGANFEKVKSNIIGFVQMRDRMKARLPIVRISCVDLLENNSELQGFVEFWKPVADYVSIQVYRPHEFTKRRLKMWPKDKTKAMNVVCTQPFERVYIRGNGDVHACCNVAFGPKIGNVHEASIYDMWNSDKMRMLQKALKHGSWENIPGCRECLKHARNT